MKATYLFGILVASALSMGCVAQAGTEDPTGSAGQDLSATTVAADQQQQEEQPVLSPQARMLRAPHVTLAKGAPVQQIQGLQGLAGTDPSAPVTDDGDGKEPDPHPWHMDTAIVATH